MALSNLFFLFFVAELCDDPDEVLVGYPAQGYDQIYNNSKMAFENSNTRDAMDKYANRFAALNHNEKLSWFLLKFPPTDDSDEIILTVNEIYIDAKGEKNKLGLRYFPFKTKHKKLGEAVNYMASWDVARVDVTSNKRGKISTAKKLGSEAAMAKFYESQLNQSMNQEDEEVSSDEEYDDPSDLHDNLDEVGS
jgi:hypothetical protein